VIQAGDSEIEVDPDVRRLFHHSYRVYMRNEMNPDDAPMTSAYPAHARLCPASERCRSTNFSLSTPARQVRPHPLEPLWQLHGAIHTEPRSENGLIQVPDGWSRGCPHDPVPGTGAVPGSGPNIPDRSNLPVQQSCMCITYT
jgi:hypothetical protein